MYSISPHTNRVLSLVEPIQKLQAIDGGKQTESVKPLARWVLRNDKFTCQWTVNK